MLAEENVTTLTSARDVHGVQTVVASCPHCFNTIRNEYPQFGLRGLRVIHHTQLLDTLVQEGRLVPTEHHEAVVAYHDACYLGRYNEVYDEGRRVVEAVPGRAGRDGAPPPARDVLRRRRGADVDGGARGAAHQPSAGGACAGHRADAIATACPYCLIMLRDGVTDLERTDVAVRDVAEWLADATGAWQAARRHSIPQRVNGIRVVLAEKLRKV